MSTPLQINYQSNQNFNIDINKIYSDFIQEIDANRSISNLNFFVTGANKIFKIETIASLSNSLKIEATPQESRAHCFYRLIGFPVIDQNGANFYNPGLDNANPSSLAKKIIVANHQKPEFLTLSLLRENYNNGILSDFNVTPPTLASSVLSLSSSINTRSFSVPVSNIDPFSFVAADQQYAVNFNSIVGNATISLNDYTDETGLNIRSSIDSNRYHFVKPFIVDPRIDFTVNPSNRRVAVPFVDNKKNLLISENTFIKRPLIEKVIRDRFASTQNAVVSTFQQQVIDYVKNTPTVKDDQLIQQMVANIYNQGSIGPIVQFEKFFFIIQAMCTALWNAQRTIQKVQSFYYWLPLPSIIGPEGGSTIKPPIISSILPSTLITEKDQSIINLSLSQFADTFETQTASLNAIPDLGGFAFSAFPLTFNSDTSQSYGNNVAKELSTLLKKRNSSLADANTALKTIEIIMGEWSGLGLCDIVAIMATLYVMPGNDVLGFLDNDAQQRAISQGVLPSGTTFPSISETQKSFVNTINNFYHLMDDIYKDVIQNNNKNG